MKTETTNKQKKYHKVYKTQLLIWNLNNSSREIDEVAEQIMNDECITQHQYDLLQSEVVEQTFESEEHIKAYILALWDTLVFLPSPANFRVFEGNELQDYITKQ